jgi:hypothetical protein
MTMTEDENAMKATAQCCDELRELDVPCQQVMEPHPGSASLAAKIRGWEQTLELLKQGRLSNSEVEVIRTELQRALNEGVECVKRGGAEKKDAARLVSVLAKVLKALELCLKVHLHASRF